ncbi:MAG TPA: hypothetical protein VFU15_06230, partial [Bacteroidia bacterium]|nr:hypothetical protein [Bacteroidia bacterium]
FMLLFLIAVGLFGVLSDNNTLFLFIKIFIGLVLSASFYYYVFRHYDFDVDFLFRMYLKGAYYAAVIGVVQFVAFRLHITPLYNFRWLFNKWGLPPGSVLGIRINSVFSEPAQCAIVLSPAAMVGFYSIFFRDTSYYTVLRSLIVIGVFILTFSSTGYFGLFIIILLLAVNFGQIANFVSALVFGAVAVFLLYRLVPEFQSRIDSTIELWIYQNYALENVNSSSFVLYNNFHVAWENFKSNFLFGTGLGSHQAAFDKYSLTKNEDILNFTFNQSDGNSMFVRLMSETGLSGLVFMFVFLRRNFVRRTGELRNNTHWLISSAMMTIILLYLLRQGNYFVNGFPFFMWMYYFNAVEYRKKMAMREEEAFDGEEEEVDGETEALPANA